MPAIQITTLGNKTSIGPKNRFLQLQKYKTLKHHQFLASRFRSGYMSISEPSFLKNYSSAAHYVTQFE